MNPFASKFTVLCLLVSSVFALPLLAQNSGSIQGTIVDRQGAVIPRASVQAVDQAKGVAVRETTTDASGLLLLTPLQPGTYSIHVRAQGMRELVRSDVVLDPSKIPGLGELKLALGATNEIMTVEARAPLVETATADHSAVIDSREVSEPSLPSTAFSVRWVP